jgi:dephospho-CoA kinase
MTENEVRDRIEAQITPERAALLADFVIENDGDRPTLEGRSRAVYEALERRRPAA